ncbi:MAG: V-type ATPase subunit [Thermoplasmatota archaeon]
MFEELLSTIGLPNLVLIIVGVSLLVVVILLMSYFRVLVSIANFTYPNAKFRAHGNPFIKEENLKPLSESRNINEVYSNIREHNYYIPKEATEDINEVEKNLELDTINYIKKAYMATPNEAKPLVNAWLAKYDIKMTKRAVKAVSRGKEKEEIDQKVLPVKMIDKSLKDEIMSARNMQELLAILKNTELDEVLASKEWENNFFELDVALDKYLYEKMRQAVMQVEAEEKSPVKYFFGRYTDILNLKIVFRGIREDINEETLKDSLLPPGRELEKWKLENMVDSSNLEEAMVELEGTSYSDLRTDSTSMSGFELEIYLDKKLLSTVSEILSQNILTVGPLIKYLVAKDLELRNLKILIRGLQEGMDSEKISSMMIMEE